MGKSGPLERAQGEIRPLHFRFNKDYSTETRMYITFPQLRVCGNAFLKLTYPQRLRSRGNSVSHRVSATSKFDDTQLSAGFPESKFNDKSRIRKVYAVSETLIAVRFPRFANLTDTQLSAGFRKGTSFTGKFKLGYKGIRFLL